MRPSVIITTYNQPEQLEKVMWGYALQKGVKFDLIVADDGSSQATFDLIDRVAADTGLDVTHVWHEDTGFRKTEILNRAIVASTGDYLILSDGDCIPRDDFVATHAQLSGPRVFLSGGYIKLPREASDSISLADVKSGRAMSLDFLKEHGWHPGRRALRFVRSPAVGRIMDAITPTRRTWNGHNSSTWREAIIEANGFDSNMGYGGLDRALGERLLNAGLKGRQIRYRTPLLHLYHERPYVDLKRWKLNSEIRKRIRSKGETRAVNGIAELADDPNVVIRRAGEPVSRRFADHAIIGR